MQIYDFFVLIGSLLVVLYFLSGDYNYEATELFYYDIISSNYLNSLYPNENEVLPSPIITDMDGDGKNEIIVAQANSKIVVLTHKEIKLIGGKTRNTVEEKYSHYLTDHYIHMNIGNLSSIFIVHMTTGYINQYNNSIGRSQVLLVMTSDTMLYCLDHKLQFLWSRNTSLLSEFIYGAKIYPEDITITVSPLGIYKNDTGAVFLGYRFRQMKQYYYERPRTERGEQLGKFHYDDDDDFDDMLPVHDGNVKEEKPFVLDDSILKKIKEYTVYAYDGATGGSRWNYTLTDSVSNIEMNPNIVKSPFDKFDFDEVHQVNDWQSYKESVLNELPIYPHITSIKLSHFEKETSGKLYHKSRHQNLDDKLSGIFNLPFNSKYPHNEYEHDVIPNVISLKLHGSLYVLHYWSGVPLTELSLSNKMVHADINGEDVINEISVFSGKSAKMPVEYSVMSGTPVNNPCYTEIHRGYLLKEEIFNASICHIDSFLSSEQDIDDINNIVLLPPLLLKTNHHYSEKQMNINRFNLVYYTNNGILAYYDSDYKLVWKVTDAPKFPHNPEFYDVFMHPSIHEYQPNKKAPIQILVIGVKTAAIYSQHGKKLGEFDLNDSLINRVAIGDINNDGITDIAIITRDYVFGYKVGIKSTNSLMKIIIYCAIVIFTLLYFNEKNKNKRPKRNSD